MGPTISGSRSLDVAIEVSRADSANALNAAQDAWRVLQTHRYALDEAETRRRFLEAVDRADAAHKRWVSAVLATADGGGR